MRDFLTFNRSFGSKRGDPYFVENADFNKDGKIDEADEVIAEEECVLNTAGK